METHRLPIGSVVVNGPNLSWFQKLMRWRMGSPWVHCFIILNENEGIESTISGGTRIFDLKERFASLEEGRAFVILDHPALTPRNADTEFLRRKLVWNLRTKYVGRRYDIVQWLLFAFFRAFMFDGPRRIICSRLVTAAFEEIGINIFSNESLNTLGSRNRFKGWCIPSDLINSDFGVIVAVQGHPSVAVNPLPAENMVNVYG